MSDGVAIAEGKKLRRPRGWLAALMSLVLPGLGQLYAGRWRVALLLMLLSQGFFPLLALLIIADALTFVTFMLCFFAAIAFQLGVAILALLAARRTAPFAPPWWNRWYGLLGIAVLYLVAGATISLLYEDPVKSFHIPAGSMHPSVSEGDRLVAVGLFGKPVDRGEIVVFQSSHTGGADYIKRVVAIGGDSIELRNNRLWVNDREVSREISGSVSRQLMQFDVVTEILGDHRYSILLRRNSDPRLANFARRAVPVGHVFVMGDNRDNSQDSRFFGPVKIEDVHWRAGFIFWSQDVDRIGLDLRDGR